MFKALKIRLNFIFIWVSFFLFIKSNSAHGKLPIIPEDVLSQEEIDAIVLDSNYFLYKDIDNVSPIWKGKNRQYGSHFLRDRTDFFELEQVIHQILNHSFPIKYTLQNLYRSRLGIHQRIGAIIPKVDLSFGSGGIGTDLGKAFSGLFGFLHPANWMELANQKRVYNIAQLLLKRVVLDELLKIYVAYIDQHQRIQEFEILNYYFVHLQLLVRRYPESTLRLKTFLGRYAFQGTEMASQRGATKLGFDDLALSMALDQISNDYTVNRFNIADLSNFPEKVEDPNNLDELYKDKGKFLENVMKRSIELKIVNELYKVSKLNIGITASGNILHDESHRDRRFHFGINFGYDTIPRILISKSFSNTAKIDVENEYLNMLDIARRSFDFYTNSLGGYTEAKRSLELNRLALKDSLDYLLTKNKPLDALLIFTIDQMIETELKFNNALHGSLRAKAYMDRFLLVDHYNALDHLPQKEQILGYFDDLQVKNKKQLKKANKLDKELTKVRKSKNLKSILYGSHQRYTKEEINFGITRNFDLLLKSSLGKYKSKHFYKLLYRYININSLQVSQEQKTKLNKKIK